MQNDREDWSPFTIEEKRAQWEELVSVMQEAGRPDPLPADQDDRGEADA